MNSYSIKLVYDYGTAQEFKEMVTHTACLELFTRNIHTTQPSASVISFESDSERTYGLLLLANDNMYTVRALD